MSVQANLRKKKMMEILNLAGLNKYKLLKAFRFPKCIEIIYTSKYPKVPYYGGDKPDDDFKITWQNKKITRGEITFPGADLKRNIGQYTKGYYKFTEQKSLDYDSKILTPGETKISIYTFDGYAGRWQNVPWQITFIFDNLTKVDVFGGDSRTGLSIMPLPSPVPPDYYTGPANFHQYYENGYAIIPAPKNWMMPNFLKFEL